MATRSTVEPRRLITRGWRTVAFVVAMVVLASLAEVPAGPPAEASYRRPAAQVDRSVPGRDARPATVRQPQTGHTRTPKPPVWPSPGVAELTLVADGAPAAGGTARVGGLSVHVAQPAGAGVGSAVSRVRVQVIEPSPAAGLNGILLRVSRADGVTTRGRARVTIDYSGFRDAYGADWSARLRLLALPECALASPEVAGCRGTALPTDNNASARTVSADVDVKPAGLPAGTGTKAERVDASPVAVNGTLLALAAGTSSGAGDYAATSLKPSSTWSAGGNSGDFSWSYPMRVPPSLGGPTPNITLAYSSQSVDGQMAASNNQPSWVGEGFEWSPGFIERRYKSCEKDKSGGNNSEDTGDLCWVRDNATMSLNGSSTELLFKSGNQWRGRKDVATRVVKATGSGNGDDNGESWVATTADGTQYFFGSTTAGTWTVPVFGNHADEPCHAAAFADSDCVQAWRWMLDKVVDRNGNTMTFTWVKETNAYARNADPDDEATYTRGGYLQRVEYGGRTGVSGTAPMRVEIAVADRCLASCWTGSPAKPNKPNWKDTPWDQECVSGDGQPCLVGAPTFWTAKRLSKVTTQLWVSGTTYRDVEWWTLHHSYPDPGDGTRAGLWLDRISHAGKNGTVTSTLPDVTFAGEPLPNRVDSTQGDWALAMKWFRMKTIVTESGATIGVSYKSTDCYAPGGLPAATHTNTKRCYPVKWIPEGRTSQVTDWFHKYVVETVTESDTALAPDGASPPVVTSYDYVGGGAWHYTDDDGLIADEDKTWSVWRGYATVKTTKGIGTEKQVTEDRYHRGMHGDKLPSGTRTAVMPAIDNNKDGDTTDPGDAAELNDLDTYAGYVRESIVYDGTTEVSAQVTRMWRSAATASRTIDGVTVGAYHVGANWTLDRVTRADNTQRVTGSRTWFDDYGLAEMVEDLGDVTVTTDDQCVVNRYGRDTSRWLISHLQQVRTFATTCTTVTNGSTLTPDDVISDTRTWYDGATAFGTAPTKGNPTRVETLNSWANGPGDTYPGGAGYLTIATTTYDAWGRPTEAVDVKGNLTKTVYTHNTAGQLTTTKVTNPMGWDTITTVDPAWGAVTRTEDPNLRVTEVSYDGLGRTSAVWLPGRSRTSWPNDASIEYTYTVRNNGPTVVTTASLLPTGGYKVTHDLFDSLLRARQTQLPDVPTTGAPQGRIISDNLYDSVGRVWKTYNPYAASGTPATDLYLPVSETEVTSVTTTLFDGAGRATASILAAGGTEKWRTTTVYGGDRSTVTPPAGGTKTETRTDARGNVVEIRQYHSHTASTFDATQYTYNRKNQLAVVTDPAGNHWNHGYDLRGRKILATDPDRGTTTNTYNDAGELTSTTDELDQVLAYTYDALGRKTTVRDNDETGPIRAKWTYDTPTTGATVRGQLFASTRYEPPGSTNAYTTEVLGYTADYQPTGTKITIPATETGLGGSYTYGHTYKVNGAPASTTIPAVGNLPPERLYYNYNNQGLPDSVETDLSDSGDEVFLVNGITYTRFGELNVLGLRWDGGKSMDIGHYYESDTRRLDHVWTTRTTAPNTVSDIHYDQDPAGNFTRISDPTTGDHQCFSHDYLRRLTEAWTPGNGDCGPAPSITGLGGPARYWFTWTFDTVGNRTQQQAYNPTTGLRDTTTYTYPTAGSPQPHTLTSTSGASTATYHYDATGNTTCRPATTTANTCPTGTGSQNLTWNPEGHLATSTDSTGQSSYLYDADGSRLIRRDPAGKTLYLPGQELRYTTTSGTKTGARYYTAAGQTIAQRTSISTSGLTWLISNHQNTANHTISNSTQTIATRYQTPYGTPRGTTGPWPTSYDKGLVGGTLDNTGLTHLGAREYDPHTGRFISVDPIQDLNDPQQWHGYAYASNSPITRSDPSGLKDCDYATCNGGGNDAVTGKPGGGAPGGGRLPGDTPPDTPRPPKPPTLNHVPLVGGPDIDLVDLARLVGKHRHRYTSPIDPILEPADTAAIIGHLCHEKILQCSHQFLQKMVMLTILLRHPNGMADIYLMGMGLRVPIRPGVPRTRRPGSCGLRSFAADTPVLMADGSNKPIKQIQVGDLVLATDPQTGEQGPRTVTHLWIHEDQLIDLKLTDGTNVTTTEDHPFWNHTDRQWQDAQHLDPGDQLLTPAGHAMPVEGLLPGTAGWGTAYNLTVEDIHTYYVIAGNTPVLVHNDDPSFDTSRQARLDAMRQAGLPTSLQPRSATYYSAGYGQGGGYQYVYDYNGKTWVVTDNWNDLNADTKHGPHWEVGEAKPRGQRDSLGRLRVDSNKTKAFYGGGC